MVWIALFDSYLGSLMVFKYTNWVCKIKMLCFVSPNIKHFVDQVKNIFFSPSFPLKQVKFFANSEMLILLGLEKIQKS